MTRKMILASFCIVGLLFVPLTVLSFWRGDMDLVSCLLAILVIITFLFLNCLVLDAFVLTRDALYVLLFAALFLWPVITTTVAYHLTGEESLAKKGLEYKIGGFGDCLSVGMMFDIEGLNRQFRRPSLVLMLGTNIIFLAPVLMMYRRVRKKPLSQNTGEKATS